MKLVHKLAIGGLAIASLLTTYAQAQVMRVSIPFNFHAGTAMLPAGNYDVRTEAGTNRVALVAVDGTAGCFLPVKAVMIPAKARRGSLLFRAYGSAYFLSSVENPGLSNGYDFFITRTEKEIAKYETPREVALAYQGAQ